MDWYYERTQVFVTRAALSAVQICTIAGSGTFCFDQRTLPLDFPALLGEIFVDIQISLLARAADLPILVLPRRAQWLTPFDVPGLWEEHRNLGQTVNTLAARDVDWSFDIYADILRGALKRARVTPEEVGLDSELTDCLRHGGIPSPWRQSPISYRQHAHYLKLLSQA